MKVVELLNVLEPGRYSVIEKSKNTSSIKVQSSNVVSELSIKYPNGKVINIKRIDLCCIDREHSKYLDIMNSEVACFKVNMTQVQHEPVNISDLESKISFEMKSSLTIELK